MKAHTFLLFFSAFFAIDQISGWLLPGWTWFSLMYLLACGILDNELPDHYWFYFMAVFITDLFSGFQFGFVAIPLLAWPLLIVVLRRWVRI